MTARSLDSQGTVAKDCFACEDLAFVFFFLLLEGEFCLTFSWVVVLLFACFCFLFSSGRGHVDPGLSFGWY